MENLDKCIADFNAAMQSLKDKEKELNEAVTALRWTEQSNEEIMELIDRLPKGYKGVRRMYEFMERRSEK